MYFGFLKSELTGYGFVYQVLGIMYVIFHRNDKNYYF